MTQPRSLTATVLIVLLVVGGFLVGLTAVSFFRNVPSGSGESTVVFVKPKSSLPQIARQLGDAGVLTSPWRLRFLVRITGNGRSLKPGEYAFKRPTSPYTTMKKLVSGDVLLHKVTFPEGITVRKVVEILVKAHLGSEEEFDRLMTDKRLLKKLKIPAESFEGFLFPDTYYFSKIDSPERILKTMVSRFRQALTRKDKKKAKKRKLNLREWITLASIIEKESTWPDEQPIVSSVFHNRLRKKMRLQTDPTVIYGIENFDGNLTRRHLETPTPYNTYVHYGLPPGPIANPGASAIQAAVNPADTEFLYFVANKKGQHVFSKTYEEHARNVARYQLRRRRR